MTFSHEKLKVYQRTLSFNARVGTWIDVWDRKHAICDHLPRAAGSMLENIAMGSASYSAMKIRSLDYALGSTLECAACLDLAGIKRLLIDEQVVSEKKELLQIVRMLVGLRRSWSDHTVREDGPQYVVGGTAAGTDKTHEGDASQVPEEAALFHHERLDLYSVALQTAESFSCSAAVCRLPSNTFRKLDALLTSIVLNIAEGNGRFSTTEQRRFLGTSHEAAIRMAARLDLCVMQELLRTDEVDGWKRLLSRISSMTSSMILGQR